MFKSLSFVIWSCLTSTPDLPEDQILLSSGLIWPILFIRDKQRLFGEKETLTPKCCSETFTNSSKLLSLPHLLLKKNKSIAPHSPFISMSLWREDVITRQQHATPRSSATRSGLSSVKQIKGGICLYCAAKSPPPLTTDTSHVDEEEEERIDRAPPPHPAHCRFVPLGGDVMQIKQTVCDFHLCRQIIMACWSNCQADKQTGLLF